VHIEIFHTWPFSCPDSNCNATFLHEGFLKEHITNKHAVPVSSPLFSCSHPNCDLEFSRKSNLQQHLEHQHKEGHWSYPLKPSYVDLQSLHVLADSAVSSSMPMPMPHDLSATELGLFSSFPTSRLRFS
jgi:hypothetical protein